MIPLSLAQITTRDGLILDGIVIEPRKKSDTALIWIHGLGSNFSRGRQLIRELSRACLRNGMAYLKFNTRGHDIVNRNAPRRKGLQGSGLERFEDCVYDVRAMILCAHARGYQKIIIAGHSTGANKALYYLYKTEDRSVKGLMLLGPVNDIAAGRKKFGAAGLRRGVALAGKLARKNPDALMPAAYGISSAARFLSMFRPGGAEDVFPYLNPAARWKELKSIRIPIAVVFGSRDAYLDRPAQKIIHLFRANAPLAKAFSGVIIKGANHGFKRKEKELARAIIGWIKNNGL